MYIGKEEKLTTMTRWKGTVKLKSSNVHSFTNTCYVLVMSLTLGWDTTANKIEFLYFRTPKSLIYFPLAAATALLSESQS